jgi:hypothetical protein
MAHRHDPDDEYYQPGQSGMYELEFPAPQLATSDGRGPVLVHALEGFSDAGHAIRLAAGHLKAALTPNWLRPSRSTNCWTTARGGR